MNRLSTRREESWPTFNVLSVSFAVLSLMMPAPGCSDDIVNAPLVEHPFTLYGALNPDVDRQTVIVYPIEPKMRPLPADPLDAVVTSTDLETGEVRVWADSVVSDGASQHSHIFWSNFRPAFGSRHRIEVVRSDGARSWADAQVPARITVEDVHDRPGHLTVRFRGEGFRLARLELHYIVRAHFVLHPGSPFIYPVDSYAFDYKGKEVKQEDGWLLAINMAEYYEWMEAWYAFKNGIAWERGYRLSGLALFNVFLRLTVVEEAWNPPGGVFDEEVVALPGAMDNVQNGFGLVGGGYRTTAFPLPTLQNVEYAGFFDFLPRP